jgi:arsenite methyltransferase
MSSVAIKSSRPRSVSLDLDSPELASTYDTLGVRQFNHGKILIASLCVQPGERVLDVGCGTGRLAEYAASLVGPSGEVVGIDALPLRVHLASAKHDNFRAQLGRAEDLSAFPSESFDVVYANSVFQRVEDKRAALREAWRVLKKNGRIGVNSTDAARSHQGAELVREAVVEEGLGDAAKASAHPRVSAEQLLELLREAGFEAIRVTAHTFVDHVSGPDELFAWSSSSAFGNFLSDLGTGQRRRVRQRLASKLDGLRAPDGSIRLERYLVFAIGSKLR